MNRLDFAQRAKEDLQEIYDYVAQDDPAAAIRLIDLIEARAKILANSPGSGSPRFELIANMRSAAAGNYVIFYLVFGDGIEIARVLNAKRDLRDLLPYD